MSPQRRIALVSIVAACVLIVVKLVSGLASNSLGLVSEAIHSGTDLVAALLTFFAVGVAGRPADPSHPYGHGKAEHLSALAEAAILVGASLVIVWQAVSRLTGEAHPLIDTAWWVFAVVVLVIVIDLSRAAVSLRSARKYGSPALLANGLHFAQRPRRLARRARRAAPGPRRVRAGGLLGGALRGTSRPGRRGSADAPERRRPRWIGRRPARRRRRAARSRRSSRPSTFAGSASARSRVTISPTS